MDIDEKVSVAIERARNARRYTLIKEVDYIGASVYVYEVLGKTNPYEVAAERMFFK